MYFHVSSRAWNVGEVINPGVWGRRVRGITSPHVPPMGGYQPSDLVNIMWEGALEVARRFYAPDAPSRTDIVFLFPTRGHALAFQRTIGGQTNVYEVQPLNPADPHHLADMDILHHVPGYLIDHVHDRCRDYWTQPPIGTPELLWGGPVEVIR